MFHFSFLRLQPPLSFVFRFSFVARLRAIPPIRQKTNEPMNVESENKWKMTSFLSPNLPFQLSEFSMYRVQRHQRL